MRHGMRVPSAFHAMRSLSFGRSPRTYCWTAGAHSRSRERSNAKAPPMRSLSSTPVFCIMASSMPSWLGVMNTESSPGSLKSVWAANRLTEASGWLARPGELGGDDGEERAADAIADRMHLAFRDPPAHLGECVQEAELHVVIHPEGAVGRVRVLPGDHEDGVTLLHQVIHQ